VCGNAALWSLSVQAQTGFTSCTHLKQTKNGSKIIFLVTNVKNVVSSYLKYLFNISIATTTYREHYTSETAQRHESKDAKK